MAVGAFEEERQQALGALVRFVCSGNQEGQGHLSQESKEYQDATHHLRKSKEQIICSLRSEMERL